MNVAAEPVGRLRRWVPGLTRDVPRRRPAGGEEGDATAGAGRVAGFFGLAPAIDVDGPRVRLGLAWGALTMVLLAAAPGLLAVVLAVAAMGAAGQAVSSWRRQPARPWRPVAVIGSLLLPLSAAAGWLGSVLVSALIVVAAVGGHRFLGQDDARLTAVIPLAVGLPAAGLLVMRAEVGVTPALVLLGMLHLWDASAFIVGSGAQHRWEAHLAAAATIAAASLLVAAVLVPPFRGQSPAILGGITIVAAPLGPYLVTLLLGDRGRRTPALRRIDVLLVAVPVWGVAAAILLR